MSPPLSAGTDGRVHLFGTDSLGRDVFSRVMYGGRISLAIGFATVSIAGVLGLVFGVLAGYLGGGVDGLMTWLTDLFLAFPFVLLAIAVVAVVGPGLRNIILVLGFVGWMVPARVGRAEALSLREREFVLAARASGARASRMVWRHIVPNILPSTIVVASLLVGKQHDPVPCQPAQRHHKQRRDEARKQLRVRYPTLIGREESSDH